MRALTLTQPWCGLVASGLKPIENRPRSIVRRQDFGTPFGLHASREISKKAIRRILEIAPELCTDPDQLWWRLGSITSAVIAVATIHDSVFDTTGILANDIRRSLGDVARWWFSDQIGYLLRDISVLPEPVGCRGNQGFWTMPDPVATAVTRQIRVAA